MSAIGELQKINAKLVSRWSDELWAKNHLNAINAPCGHEQLYEAVTGIAGWIDAYTARYRSKPADDGVLGPCCKDILTGLRGLLNGEMGRLDCGTLDHALLVIGVVAGFNEDEL